MVKCEDAYMIFCAETTLFERQNAYYKIHETPSYGSICSHIVQILLTVNKFEPV